MPLRIALDYRPAVLSRAGIGRATRELAKALAARGDVELHLFAHSLARARVATTTPANARLHRLPLPGRALPALARLGFGADRLAGRAGVFHWTDYVHPPLSRARAVLTVHDLAFARDPRWHGAASHELLQRTRAAIARAAAVVVPSQTTATDLRAFVPEAPAPRVIPFGADHVDRAPRPHPLGGRPFAVCVGTIEPRKNHLALLAAWRRVPEPRPLLVVVGARGWECAGTEAALRAAVADGTALWRERADDDELWALLQHARLVCYPSLWEGFGFPPLEAMALGVPVLAHATPALDELGDGAIATVDTHDDAAFGAALERAIRDEAWRSDRMLAGRRRADTFRWSRCAEQHAAVYREVAAC